MQGPGPRAGASVMVLLAAFPLAAAAPASAAVQPCASVAIFGLRGSGQTSGYGQEVSLVAAALKRRLVANGRTVAEFPVAYTAASTSLLMPQHQRADDYYFNVKAYLASVRNGADALGTSLDLRATRCPTESPVLIGFSQGSMAIRVELRRLAANGETAVLRRIGAVGLVGDPTKRSSDYNVANAAPGSRGIATRFGISGAPINIPDPVLGRAILSCVDGDVVCDFSLQSARNGGARVHTTSYGPVRADRLAQAMLNPTLRRSQPAPAPASSTPPATTTPPPSAPAPPPPAPDVTYAETTGGVTHTWTNYLNAGGYEGSTIAGQQTIQISCKIGGFRVADGNTWWYRIASAPWNYTYYASADAFYNNGATSGSLLGTPFVDPNVPDCAGSGARTGPGPVAETTGGVTHTWTNYFNAGGFQGQTIGGQQTVQITCKVQGFRVADGNTWWYQVGSAPWNNAYYASADAFYNNGATSGTLIGTPFVDPNVPDCRGA